MNAPAAIPPPPELKRLLVVDDEELVLEALRETLRLEGYEVLTFSEPLEALEILRSTPVSVLITDQNMPAISGLEFIAQAREIQPNAIRILITAVLNLGTVIEAINRGEVYRFIVKPWLREELLVTIRNAVRRYELVCTNKVLYAQTAEMNQRLSEQLVQLDSQNQQLDQLNRALQKNLDRSIQLCLKTMETFYPVLGQSARRVFAFCQAMAKGLDLPDDQRQVLEISSRLFDIGLVGVPRDLIHRWQESPESVTEQERAAIELHPAVGAELVSFVADLQDVGATIRAHHEWYDGSGYPDRLSGDSIPWLARLLAVAIGYALCPLGEKAALEYVKTASGTMFDPDAVRAFLRGLPHAVAPRSQRALLLAELRPGMIIAQGIYTAQGILLIPEGQSLTQPHIERLRNHHRMNPITQSLLVYG
jgi:response regulator RpfG family c-di-GMP phosphodiesterase